MNTTPTEQAAAILKATDGLNVIKENTVAYSVALSAVEAALAKQLELPPLEGDLLEILGRPCFACIRIANRMRQLGHVIKTRAENEQAAVIHLLLGLYLKHGTEWAEKAAEYLENKPAAAGATTTGEPA